MSNSKWIGPPMRQAEGRTLYGSCEIESGETLCLGDYVHMLPENPTLELFTARIESLFEADGAKFVQVRWLYRETNLKHSPPSVPRECEVFYTNYFDCQLVQSIVGPCQVVKDCSTSTCRKIQDNSSEVHVCRYSYSEESGVFTDILPSEIDPQHLLLNDDPGELAADENTNADAKDLAHMLLQIERGMPPETSTVLWQARRMAWVHNLKAVTNLEQVKEALLELEDGYHVFTNQTSWRESIRAVESSDTLLQRMKGFSDEMQVKAGVFDNEKAEAKVFNRLRPGNSYRKKHKRKRGPPLLVSSPISEKQAWQDLFKCKSIYEIEQKSLPPDAPQQLKNLRAALVSDTTKEYVTIAFPSMASLAEYFEELNVSTDGASQERIITKCLFNDHSTSTRTMPRFDEEFSMTHETAQRVLKSLITSPECLQQGNFELFWLMPGLDTTCGMTQTQANKEEICCNAKDIASLSPNQDPIKKHRFSEKNSPKVLKFYTHKKLWWGKPQVSPYKHGNPSETESSGKQTEQNNSSTQEREVSMSLGDANWKDAPPLQHAVDNNPSHVFTVDREKKSQNHDASEENQSIVRWGVRKKITSRCRSNTFGDDSRNKGHYCKENKQHYHEVVETGHRSNAYKGLAAARTLTGIEKGKMLKVPKLMEGRWSTERYKAAQLRLFEIMKDKGAVPGKPLLRPALRVEARKHIGDTGLLDHLLKHMTDTVINDGERFRRRHNSEGAMEYWLEDARLQDLRKKAGVDQYWIPPRGWKIGDEITNSKNEGMSSSQLTELKHLREEVQKLKSQLQSVCLHVGASLLESQGTYIINRESDFQSWKKIEESITKSQETKEKQLKGSRQIYECHNPYSQRSSIAKHSEAKIERVTSCRNGNQDKLTATQNDSHPASQLTGILQANTVADNAEKEKANTATHEMRKIVMGEVCDEREGKSGDEIAFFYKAAARPGNLDGKLGDGLTRPKQGNIEKKSPDSETTKEAQNKENMDPMRQQGELITKAFQGWKKTQSFIQREVFSAISANVASSLCKSPNRC